MDPILTREDVERLSLQLQGQLHAVVDAKDTRRGVRKALGRWRHRAQSDFNWFLRRGELLTSVVESIPMSAPYAPLLKVIFAVALLPIVGKEARFACDKVRLRLVEIYYDTELSGEESIFNRKIKKIEDDLEVYVEEHLKDKHDIRLGLKSDEIVAFVGELLERIEYAQQNDQVRLMNSSHRRTLMMRKLLKIMQSMPPSALKERYPSRPALFGRNSDVSKVIQQLQTPNDQGRTQHVALHGIGGIGKTSLAIEIGHRSQNRFGRPIFVRCERLPSLRAFQAQLLVDLRTKSLGRDEDPGDAIQEQLEQGPCFLILNNLFHDSFDMPSETLDDYSETLDDYLNYVSHLADVPTVTLLITSRYTGLDSVISSSRRIHPYNVLGLERTTSEMLFRQEFREPRTFDLNGTNHDTLQTILGLLDGIPLAIQLVAAYARSQRSLEDVLEEWKLRDIYTRNPYPGHSRSLSLQLQLSIDLSFTNSAFFAPATIGFLQLLASLPYPILRSHAPDEGSIGIAIDTILDTSVGQ
ncbi:hypothetical protein P7C70_g8285, partial [Phenoliferia sp. Uapishka_3]